MICRRRGLIFVHIPKTGGSSVEDMIWPKPRQVDDLWMGFTTPGFNKYQSGGLQHLTLRHIQQEVDEAFFDSAYTFAFVRDPVDRLVSQYNSLNKRNDLLDLLSLDASRDFSTYLLRIQGVTHVQWMKQMDFVVDRNGQIVPDIYPLENIKTDFSRLAARTGLNAKRLIHTNTSARPRWSRRWVTINRSDLTRAHLETIYDHFQEDFEQFNYPKPF